MTSAVFFKANKAYARAPGKFKAKPRLPGYSKKATTTLQPFQSLSIKAGFIHFPKRMNMQPLAIHCIDNQPTLAKHAGAKEIRFVPHGNYYWVEVVYDREYIGKTYHSIVH